MVGGKGSSFRPGWVLQSFTISKQTIRIPLGSRTKSFFLWAVTDQLGVKQGKLASSHQGNISIQKYPKVYTKHIVKFVGNRGLVSKIISP